MKYSVNLRCKNCSRLAENSGHGVEVYNSFRRLKFCNECGSYDGWKESIEYYTSTSTWWKPSTWGQDIGQRNEKAYYIQRSL